MTGMAVAAHVLSGRPNGGYANLEQDSGQAGR